MLRRTFIKLGALAAAGLALVRGKSKSSPLVTQMQQWESVKGDSLTLYGDGIHDDTLALRTWLRGEDVYTPIGTLAPDEIRHAKFAVSGNIWPEAKASKRNYSHNSFIWIGPDHKLTWSPSVDGIRRQLFFGDGIDENSLSSITGPFV